MFEANELTADGLVHHYWRESSVCTVRLPSFEHAVVSRNTGRGQSTGMEAMQLFISLPVKYY